MASIDFGSFVALLDETGSSEKLLEFCAKEPEQLLDYVTRLTETGVSTPFLSVLTGSAFFSQGQKAMEVKDVDKALDFVEKAINSCKDIPSDSGAGKTVDNWAKILGMNRPGKAQEILGKTKLKHLGNRIYPFKDDFALSDEALAPFADIWLSPSKIVKSAVIFSKIPENKRITFMLYDIEQPWEEADAEGMSSFKYSPLMVTIHNNGEVSYTGEGPEKQKNTTENKPSDSTYSAHQNQTTTPGKSKKALFIFCIIGVFIAWAIFHNNSGSNTTQNLASVFVGKECNLRSTPSKGRNIIKTIPKGSSVTIIENSGVWTKVRYANSEGYINSSILK